MSRVRTYANSRAADLSRPFTYTADFVSGQVVYLDGESAYAVTRSMPQAVTGLLGVIQVPGPSGTRRAVVLTGEVDVPVSLLAGQVLLGNDGFPANGPWDESSNFVPLGTSEGGSSFFFAPSVRYFRS